MAKIARFNEYINEDSKITDLEDFEYININDGKLASKIKFDPKINYKYMDVVIHFDHSTAQHMENEGLRYSAIFGYGDYSDEGIPKDFDWVVYGKTPELLVSELKRMVHEYMEANPRKKTKKPKALAESKLAHKDDEWEKLTDEKKIEQLMKRLDTGFKRKKIGSADADKIRTRINREIIKSGPDKIRLELMKRKKSEEEIESGEEGAIKGGLSKIKRFVKDQVHDAVWKNTSPFWNNVHDLMSFD